MLHSVVRDAVKALEIADQIPQLTRAADFSTRLVDEARNELANAVPPDELPLDVVALGSVARQEASDTSDFDYLVVTHELVQAHSVRRTRELIAAVDNFMNRARLGQPGATGMFGQVVSAPEFTERIGLQQDSNVTHTHRMLLLEESVSVYRPDLHDDLLESILARYLVDYEEPKPGVPRFLLNDVERYWRTLCVDYQAKRWSLRTPQGWGLRYLKLIISRKLAFVGTITSLLLCERATVEYLFEQFRMPPLARFAQLHSRLDADRERESLREVLLIAEEFAAALGDKAFREEANAVGERREIEPGSRFDTMRDRARTMQEHLEVIFFDSFLGPMSRKYLSF